MAALTAFLISFLFGPWLIRKLTANQIGQQIRPDGPERHQSKAGTPTMGGVLILSSLILATLLLADLTNRYVWLVLLVTLGFAAIGFIDDYRKLSGHNSKGSAAARRACAGSSPSASVAGAVPLSRPALRHRRCTSRSSSICTSTSASSTSRSPRCCWSAPRTRST